MQFENGLKADFYGVDGNCFKLGDTIFRAEEDESDGYRSCLRDIEIVGDPTGLIFFQTPIATVMVRTLTESNGYSFSGEELLDLVDGHRWLLVGTTNDDDYYPWFTFEYTPKEAK